MRGNLKFNLDDNSFREIASREIYQSAYKSTYNPAYDCVFRVLIIYQTPIRTICKHI
jgi:hypothetical protein